MRAFFALVLLTLAACSGGSTGTLFVDLRTDLVPGVEFDEATVLIDGEVRSNFSAEFAADFLRGVRVASIEGLSRGSVRGELQLLDRSARVVSRPFTITLSSASTVITLVATRDCRGVACPDSSPSATACLGGRCVDPRCTPETPEFCPAEPQCVGAAGCPPMSACSTATCNAGVCLYGGECDAGLYCSPESDCVPIPSADDAGIDADAGDAGVDARPPTTQEFRPCIGAERPLLVHGHVVGREGDPTFTGQFLGGPLVESFVPAHYEGGEGELMVMGDGSFEFTPGLPTLGGFSLEVSLAGFEEVRTCFWLQVVDESIKRYLGGDWLEDASFAPDGVPGFSDAVYIPVDQRAMVPEGAPAFATLFAGTGSSVEFRAVPRPGSVFVTGGVIESRLVGGILSAGGRFRSIDSTNPTGNFSVVGPLHATEGFTLRPGRVILGPGFRITSDNIVIDGAVISDPIGLDAVNFSGNLLDMRVAQGEWEFRSDVPTFSFVEGGGLEDPHLIIVSQSSSVTVGLTSGALVSLVGSSGDTATFTEPLSLQLLRADRPIAIDETLRVGVLGIGPGFSFRGDLVVGECSPLGGAPPDLCEEAGL